MLKSRKLKAIEVLVFGGTEQAAALAAKVDRSTLWRWREDPEFASELMNRTQEETLAARRVVGACARRSMNLAMRGIERLEQTMDNPKAPEWMAFQAAQSSMKNARWWAEKLDEDFNKLETIGKFDRDRQSASDDCIRKMSVQQNRDRFLNQLQEYELRRMQNYIENREAALLRRKNILADLGPEDQAFLKALYRRYDEQEEELEHIRRQKARADYADAADLKLKELPPKAPVKWSDIRKQFPEMVLPSKKPATEAEAEAELKRGQKLSYPDPNSEKGKAQAAKFAENLAATEADYRANILPKQPASPIEREQKTVPVPTASKARRARWSGPIPDQDSPDHEAYVNSLADDEVPQLSEADRQRKADWDARRAATEAREAEHFRKQKKKKHCA